MKWIAAYCDKKVSENPVTVCHKSAYAEVYWNLDHADGAMAHWSYLCRWCYYLDRIRNFIYKWGNGYVILDNEGYEDEDKDDTN